MDSAAGVFNAPIDPAGRVDYAAEVATTVRTCFAAFVQSRSNAPSLVVLDEPLAEVVAGWVDSRADVVMFAGPSLPWPLSGADLMASTRQPGRAVYVLADDGGDPVATGSLLDRGDTMRIGRVLVAPARRGEGWGRVLMTELIERATERDGVWAISLGVYEHNLAARRLYGRLGFVETGVRGRVSVDDEIWTSLELVLPVRAGG